MHEKLIELLTDNLLHADNPLQLANEEIVDRLADHLLQSGIVVLPCNVGDVVFCVNSTFDEVLEATVIQVEFNYYTEPKTWITIEYIHPYTGELEYKSRTDLMFGKTVFLTKEEAEKALERMTEQ